MLFYWPIAFTYSLKVALLFSIMLLLEMVVAGGAFIGLSPGGV